MKITNDMLNAALHGRDLLSRLARGEVLDPDDLARQQKHGPHEHCADLALWAQALGDVRELLIGQLHELVDNPPLEAKQLELPDEKLVELRLKAIELGTQLAKERGKPHHAPYIAGDLYKFLLTGQKPKGPPRAAKEVTEG